MQVHFTVYEQDDDGSDCEVSLVADFTNGGIGSYEYHGQKGYHSEPELEEITIEGNCPVEIEERVLQKIDNYEYNEKAWEAFNNR